MLITAMGAEPYAEVIVFLRKRLRHLVNVMREEVPERVMNEDLGEVYEVITAFTSDILRAEETLWEAVSGNMSLEDALGWYEDVCKEREVDTRYTVIYEAKTRK